MFEFTINYELFLFDLDGCIIDSEYLHYESYKKSLDKFKINIDFNYINYTKLLHSCNSDFKKFINNYIDYNSFYKFKEEIFENLIDNINFIDGAKELLLYLIENNKNICIVTNSSLKRVEILKKKIPFFNKIKFWITKDNCFKPKPNSECYIKAIKMFDIPFEKILIFEDSFKGFNSIKHLPVNKILIQKNDYYYYNDITCSNKYNNFFEIDNIKLENKNNITNKILTYQNEIGNFANSIEYIIEILSSLIFNCEGSIYLCGIGKSRLVCEKCVSTWQSLGIHANTLITQDLFHGNFGIFKNDDIIIYISNSGNTNELIIVSEYIKKNFNLFQISISNNKNNLIKNFTNLDFVLGNRKIIEADEINMAPSISSVVFMILLDLIGINISEINKFTVNDFKKYHPGGELGK